MPRLHRQVARRHLVKDSSEERHRGEDIGFVDAGELLPPAGGEAEHEFMDALRPRSPSTTPLPREAKRPSMEPAHGAEEDRIGLPCRLERRLGQSPAAPSPAKTQTSNSRFNRA